MDYIEIVVIGISLAMDALAVAVCKGIALRDVKIRQACHAGLYFGVMQALMPVIGFFLGRGISGLLGQVDHWVIFCLFCILGANMIYESLCVPNEELDSYVDFYSMIMPAVATSIDALIVGVSFALLSVNIFLAVSIIGIITFILTSIGVYVGGRIGEKNSDKTKLLGGIILILIGLKTLFEHLGS